MYLNYQHVIRHYQTYSTTIHKLNITFDSCKNTRCVILKSNPSVKSYGILFILPYFQDPKYNKSQAFVLARRQVISLKSLKEPQVVFECLTMSDFAH